MCRESGGPFRRHNAPTSAVSGMGKLKRTDRISNSLHENMNIIAIKRKSDGKSCYHLVVALFAINTDRFSDATEISVIYRV